MFGSDDSEAAAQEQFQFCGKRGILGNSIWRGLAVAARFKRKGSSGFGGHCSPSGLRLGKIQLMSLTLNTRAVFAFKNRFGQSPDITAQQAAHLRVVIHDQDFRHAFRSFDGRSDTPPASGCQLLVRLRDDAQIRFDGLPAAGEFLLGRFVGNCGNDDAIVAVLPIDRRRHAVIGREL